MKLYKYRSLTNLEYTFDILLNERLHCAPYDQLNDPFEGLFFSVAHWGGMSGIVAGSMMPGRGYGFVPTVKSPRSLSELTIPGGTRVCSLSASLSDVRLWSHYADGHKRIIGDRPRFTSERFQREVEVALGKRRNTARVAGRARIYSQIKSMLNNSYNRTNRDNN